MISSLRASRGEVGRERLNIHAQGHNVLGIYEGPEFRTSAVELGWASRVSTLEAVVAV